MVHTLIIDRKFRGVGRIKRATGTTNPAVYRKLSRMLTALADEGRIDILRAIRDDDLELMVVHEAYQRSALDQLPLGDTLQLLADSMETWIDKLRIPHDCSEKHQVSLEMSRKYFEREWPKATVAELPRLLDRLRDTLGSKHPRSFNLARSAALAFVRDTLKRNHPLWLAIAAVEPRKVPRTTKRSPLSPDAMRGFFPDPATDQLDAIAWGMVATGMGTKEYFGAWSVRSDRVHIAGTKREGRVRDVPLVMLPAVPRMHRRTFENKLRDRTNRAITPYDLRRTFANWLESAGIPRTRRRMYLGHGARDVTDLYEQHEVTTFLVEDAQKVRTFLKLPDQAAPGVRLHVSGGEP